MMPAIPPVTSQWTVTAKDGFDGLRYEDNVPIPDLTATECLVQIDAVSLNYRDIAIPTGRYPMKFKDNVVPCSDGAGTVVAVGPNVKLHKIGDKVCSLFNQEHQKGFLTPAIMQTSLGSHRDGVLRQYAAFDETTLVPAPTSLTLRESATLPCAALTAWNALYGISDRALDSGDYVLVQGTGGVSLFAAQFALAAGAVVIATTSSDSKGEELKKIGVQHVINYKNDQEWGQTARKLTPDHDGVHHIIEVGGETTMAQSLKAIRCEGVISIIGFLGGNSDKPQYSFADVLSTNSIVRGVRIGSKEQFVAMNEFIDEHKVKPFIDQRVFEFNEVKEAYQYMDDQKHWGKIVIDVAGED